jgi:hypothetical protein
MFLDQPSGHDGWYCVCSGPWPCSIVSNQIVAMQLTPGLALWSADWLSQLQQLRLGAYLLGGMWSLWRAWLVINGDVSSLLPIVMCSTVTFLLVMAEITHASERAAALAETARQSGCA